MTWCFAWRILVNFRPVVLFGVTAHLRAFGRIFATVRVGDLTFAWSKVSGEHIALFFCAGQSRAIFLLGNFAACYPFVFVQFFWLNLHQLSGTVFTQYLTGKSFACPKIIFGLSAHFDRILVL